MGKITQKSINILLKSYRDCKKNIVLRIKNPNNTEECLMEIPVKNELSIEDKGNFIDRVANACFDTDGNFVPQYFEPVFEITLLQMLTPIPVFEQEIELDDGTKTSVVDIEKTYALCNAIDLIYNIKDKTFQHLVIELKDMVDEKIDFMKQMKLSSEKRALSKAREEIENGTALLLAVGQQLNETLSNVSGLNEVSDAIKNLDYDKMISSVMNIK